MNFPGSLGAGGITLIDEMELTKWVGLPRSYFFGGAKARLRVWDITACGSLQAGLSGKAGDFLTGISPVEMWGGACCGTCGHSESPTILPMSAGRKDGPKKMLATQDRTQGRKGTGC